MGSLVYFLYMGIENNMGSAYLYAEYIMRNAGLHEAQAGIKTTKKNINNLRYADHTNLMAKAKRN